MNWRSVGQTLREELRSRQSNKHTRSLDLALAPVSKESRHPYCLSEPVTVYKDVHEFIRKQSRGSDRYSSSKSAVRETPVVNKAPVRIPSLPYYEDPYQAQQSPAALRYPINLEIGVPRKQRESLWMSKRGRTHRRNSAIQGSSILKACRGLLLSNNHYQISYA